MEYEIAILAYSCSLFTIIKLVQIHGYEAYSNKMLARNPL